MADFIDRLVYGSGIDTSGLFQDTGKMRKELGGMGDFAAETFQVQIARELAKSIDPNDFKRQVNLVRKQIENFGDKAKKTFETAIGRETAKKMFKPLRDESQTFFGQLKKSIKGGFDFKQIALGTAAGIGLTSVVRGIGEVSAETIALARDAEETRSKFNVVFGDMSDSVRAWANDFADSVGRARIDTEDFLSRIRGFLEPMNLAGDAADEMSKTLVKLAVDVASFNNAADADVVRDFQSAISGESEPVKKYGILINEARVQQEAWSSGIAKAGVQLTDQQKVLARYQLLLKDTVVAQGDAIRTSDSLANQQKRLQANVKNLGESIGNFLLPAVNSIVTNLNNTISAFGGLSISMEGNIARLKELGVSAEELKKLERSAEIRKTATEIDELNKKLEETIEFAASRSFRDFGIIPLSGAEKELASFAKGQEKSAELFGEILKSGENLEQVEKRIKELADEEISIRKSINTNLAKGTEASKEKAEQEQLSLKFIEGELKFLEENLDLARQIQQQNKINSDLKENITEGSAKQVEHEKAISAEVERIKNLTLEQLQVEKKTNKENIELIDSLIEKRKREIELLQKANDIINQITKEQELFNTQTDVERQIISIRQRAEEQRKSVQGQADAIKKINEFEQQQIKQTIFEFQKSLETASVEVLEELSQNIKDQDLRKEIDAKLDVVLGKIEIDVIAKSLEEQNKKIRDELTSFFDFESEAKTGSESAKASLTVFADDITGLFGKLGSDLFGLSGDLANVLGSIVSQISSFVSSIASGAGSPIGLLSGGIGILTGVVSAFLGKTTSAVERERARIAEIERKDNARRMALLEEQREAQERLNKKTQEYSDALRDLTNIIDDATFAQLDTKFEQARRRLEQIVGADVLAGIDLTIFSPERARRLQDEFDQLVASIIPGQATPEQEQRMAELLNQMVQPPLLMVQLLEGLTETQQAEVRALLEQLGLLSDELKGINTFSTGFTGILEKLSLEFELFDIDDPIEKLRKLRESIGLNVDDIDSFVSRGFDALVAGGDEFAAFLAEFNLADLTRDEFIELLRQFESLQDEIDSDAEGLGNAGSNVTDAIRNLISGIQSEFDLLDIDDPAKQLEIFRERLQEQFGVLIPEVGAGFDAFIQRAVAAFSSGGDDLTKFLTDFGLLGISEDQIKDIIRLVERLDDEIDSAGGSLEEGFEEITGISAVKSVTFEQGNVMLDELGTMRVGINRLVQIAESIGVNTLGDLRRLFVIVRGATARDASRDDLTEMERRDADNAESIALARGF